MTEKAGDFEAFNGGAREGVRRPLHHSGAWSRRNTRLSGLDCSAL